MNQSAIFVRRLPTFVAAFFVALGLLLAPHASADEANPALWKLSDSDSEIWLFGTVHILNPDLKWRSAKVNAAFWQADTFISEAPVADADPSVLQPLVMEYGLNRSGVPFFDQLSDSGRADFRALVKSLGMPESAIQQFAVYRPWLAGVSLGAMQVQARGGDPEAGVDKTLWRDASFAGKSLVYFETIEEQFALFGTMEMASELAFFEAGVKQMVEEPALLDDIINEWRVGNVENLGDKLNAALEGQEELHEKLLIGRNQNWAWKIKQLMDGSGKVFIAVGAGHLAGQGSVQDWLENYDLHAVRQ